MRLGIFRQPDTSSQSRPVAKRDGHVVQAAERARSLDDRHRERSENSWRANGTPEGVPREHGAGSVVANCVHVGGDGSNPQVSTGVPPILPSGLVVRQGSSTNLDKLVIQWSQSANRQLGKVSASETYCPATGWLHQTAP